jgi:hypothetical protein
MTFNGPLEGRVAIQELVSSYGDAVSRRNAADVGTLWAENATWVHPFFGEIVGRGAITEACQNSMSDIELIVFRSDLGTLVIDGDFASGRCWTSELVVGTDNIQPEFEGVHTGLYEDEYEKFSGVWLFRRRRLHMLHRQRLIG